MNRNTKWKRHGDGQLYSDKAVMELLLRGKTRPEICGKLNMPMGTVNACCTRIYKQAGCKNIMEFILKHGAG
ncbi:hypothetical protein LJC56_06030 [Christensenellaceae bacterium OttesenSCG-928-K19]|nr:hypothetical protein [Christensenellaceae bacterium OttesenSCG-928-K19]